MRIEPGPLLLSTPLSREVLELTPLKRNNENLLSISEATKLHENCHLFQRDALFHLTPMFCDFSHRVAVQPTTACTLTLFRAAYSCLSAFVP